VIALSGQVQALTQISTDPGELRAAVAAVQPGDNRASFGELARYLRTVSEAQKVPIEVHLISDLQKSAMPPGFVDLRLDPGTTLLFHPLVGGEKNWAVENVTAPRRIYGAQICGGAQANAKSVQPPWEAVAGSSCDDRRSAMLGSSTESAGRCSRLSAPAAVVHQRRASTMTRPRARPHLICRLGVSHGHYLTVPPVHGYRHIHHSRVSTQVN